ncbi:hypothetical protein MMC24_006891 [Lignoscripta atroalba]|nr:hypothetical protein [Lignoscripta atroalba]
MRAVHRQPAVDDGVRKNAGPTRTASTVGRRSLLPQRALAGPDTNPEEKRVTGLPKSSLRQLEVLAGEHTCSSTRHVLPYRSGTDEKQRDELLIPVERKRDDIARSRLSFSTACAEGSSASSSRSWSSRKPEEAEIDLTLTSLGQDMDPTAAQTNEAASHISCPRSDTVIANPLRDDSVLLPSSISKCTDTGQAISQTAPRYTSKTPGLAKQISDKDGSQPTHSVSPRYKPTAYRAISSRKNDKAGSQLSAVPRVPPLQLVSSGRQPAFSTLQQPFRPRKSSKVIPASLATDPLNQLGQLGGISHECAQLQIELLHLHLLHARSAAAQNQWQHSAEKYYRDRFRSLAEQHAKLKDQESNIQQQVNITAIRDWCRGLPDGKAADRLRVLVKFISEVSAMIGAEGKHTHTVKAFEHWYMRASCIRQPREQFQSPRDGLYDFVEGIGDGWRAEMTLLERELGAFLRELQVLGKPDEGSSLARVLNSFRIILTDMMEELEIMWSIEDGMVSEDQLWVKESVSQVAFDVSNDIGQARSN